MSGTVEAVTAVETEPLIRLYGGLICDLDGVVYRSTTAVPGAVETLNRVVGDDVPVAFVTNSASRSPDSVGTRLRELGLRPRGWSVVTSSQAAAAYLADRLCPGAPVFAVGGPGVAHALAEAGLSPVDVSEVSGSSVEAVVQGLGIDVTWRELAEVGYLAERGVPWVATNLDLVLPTARGSAPGNGALVAAVQSTTTRTPHVTGKPRAAMFELGRARLGTDRRRTLVCGDRLDTDIAGANAARLDSILVLSGVSCLQDLAFAAAHERPMYAASDLTGLLEPGLPLRPTSAEPVDLTPDGLPRVCADGDLAARLQSVIATAWAALDAGCALARDAGAWRGLERRVGLARP